MRKKLQHADIIPAHREFIVLLQVVCTKQSFDITILHQTLGAPQSNTERSMRGLNCKAAADMRKDKTAAAEHTFDVNGCGYVTEGSAQ